MRTSSKNPEKATACGYLLTNLLVLPGVGTLMAGKKTEGVLQIILAVLGVAVSLVGIFMLLVTLMKSFSQAIEIFLGLPFWIAVAGILIFLVAWVWSAWSVYPLIRSAKTDEAS